MLIYLSYSTNLVLLWNRCLLHIKDFYWSENCRPEYKSILHL